jgi:hypothetical protein
MLVNFRGAPVKKRHPVENPIKKVLGVRIYLPAGTPT